MNSTIKPNENLKEEEKDTKINEIEIKKSNNITENKLITEGSFPYKILNLFSQKKDSKGSLKVHILSNLLQSPYTIIIDESQFEEFESNVIKLYSDHCTTLHDEGILTLINYIMFYLISLEMFIYISI